MKININDHIVKPCKSATLERARAAQNMAPPSSPPWGVNVRGT